MICKPVIEYEKSYFFNYYECGFLSTNQQQDNVHYESINAKLLVCGFETHQVHIHESYYCEKQKIAKQIIT